MSGTGPDLFAWTDGVLDRRRVTQCALARVCGACQRPLGRPIAFLGTDDEVGRNEFHAPPLHTECVGAVLAGPGADWSEVRTSGYEYVRPGRDERDQLPRFVPNSLIS